MVRQEKIKPCPFCGNDVTYFITDINGSVPADKSVMSRVLCEGCGACGPWIEVHTDLLHINQCDDSCVNAERQAQIIWNKRNTDGLV